MNAISDKICLNQDYVSKNHLKLILNSLETGFIAMREFRENLEIPKSEDIIHRKLIVDLGDEQGVIFNEIQKIHLSELNYEDSKVLEDGYLTLDRFIEGIPIHEDQIIEETKNGNIVGYSKELESYYVIRCKEF